MVIRYKSAAERFNHRMRWEMYTIIGQNAWASTYHLAASMRKSLDANLRTQRVYRELKRMESVGLISRHKMSSANNICWQLRKNPS